MRRIAFLTFVLAFAAGLVFSQSQPLARCTVQRIKVHGKSLEGNLEGDSPERDVSIYLPPGYDKDRNRRYPVLYLLHGYNLTDEFWTGKPIPGSNVRRPNVPAAMDKLSAGGNPMIVVMPNAYTVHAGSNYSSSVTTGDWEAYIAEDLVSYVDAHYRTIPNRMSRGLAGHSMGGYGTIRIGMKRPDVFSSLYIMSACCLINNDDKKGWPPNPQVGASLAAAFSPNPKNPPQYFDEPVKDGQPQPLVVAKWAAAEPLAMIDQYVTSLKKYQAIAAEVGLQDALAAQNRKLDQAITDFGIAHTFESYEGGHVDRVPERIEGRVLPFFSKNLSRARSGKQSVSQ